MDSGTIALLVVGGILAILVSLVGTHAFDSVIKKIRNRFKKNDDPSSVGRREDSQ